VVGISFGVPTSKFPCLERCQLCILSILSFNSSSQNDYGIFFILSKNDKFFGFFVVVVFYFGFVVVVVFPKLNFYMLKQQNCFILQEPF